MPSGRKSAIIIYQRGGVFKSFRDILPHYFDSAVKNEHKTQKNGVFRGKVISAWQKSYYLMGRSRNVRERSVPSFLGKGRNFVKISFLSFYIGV